MTEPEWLDCKDPEQMLQFLAIAGASVTEWLAASDPIRTFLFLEGNASDRRLRLLACAYCRTVWRFLNKASRSAVLLGEQMADGPVSESHRQAVLRAAIAAVSRFGEPAGD